MSTFAQALLLAIHCICLGETVTSGPLSIARTSLDGFTVAGPQGSVSGLSASEAAMVLAGAVVPAAPAVAEPKRPADLLRVSTWSGVTYETWIAGPVASRREGQLRRRLGPGVSERGTKAAPFSRERAKVTFRYPASADVPAIEVVS